MLNMASVGSKAFLLLAALSLFLAGCSPHLPPKSDFHEVNQVEGLSELLEKGDVRLIWMHGMCKPDPEYVIKRATAITAGIGGTRQKLPDLESGRIQRFVDTVNGNTLESTYIVWSDFTETGKENLADETEQIYSAALANEFARTHFLQTCLADVTAYLSYEKTGPNEYKRNALRRWLEKQVCKVLRGEIAGPGECILSNRNKPVPVVIVTHSLGSKMMIDALNAIAPTSGLKSSDRQVADRAERAARAFSNQTGEIRNFFMLANQISLLDMTPQLPEKTIKTDSSESAQQYRVFSDDRNFNTKVSTSNTTFVDFTDPNDVLSARLTAGKAFPDKFKLINFTISNNKTVLGLFANPQTHCNYPAVDYVMGVIVNGYREHGKYRKSQGIKYWNCTSR